MYKYVHFYSKCQIYPYPISPWGFPDGLAGKESTCNAGDVRDVGSIPGLGRSPGGRNDNPLQYSYLKNPMDREAWQATVQRVSKSRVLNRLSTKLSA